MKLLSKKQYEEAASLECQRLLEKYKESMAKAQAMEIASPTNGELKIYINESKNTPAVQLFKAHLESLGWKVEVADYTQFNNTTETYIKIS